jgi:hypothetical protein
MEAAKAWGISKGRPATLDHKVVLLNVRARAPLRCDKPPDWRMARALLRETVGGNGRPGMVHLRSKKNGLPNNGTRAESGIVPLLE